MQTEKKGSRKKMKNSNRSRIIALACCVVLLVSALIGGGMAKYVTQKVSSGDGKPFTAQLFESEFALQELEATLQTNGEADMNENIVLKNTYYMTPGTQIYKYPYVSYQNKTSIPAYLYLAVEGTDSVLGEFEYELDAAWSKITGTDTTPKVYVLCAGEGEAQAPVKLPEEGIDSAAAIPIIKNASIYITKLQKLVGDKSLTFAAYAVQAPDKTKNDLAYATEVWTRRDGAVNGQSQYLVDTTAQVVNTFTPAAVAASVVEEFDGTTKSSVQIKNEGNVPALVRARLIVNWIKLDKNGNPELDAAGNPKLIAAPQGVTDPTVNNINTTKWTKIGDYYYYNGYVQPSTGIYAKNDGTQMTANLLAGAVTAAGTPAGYQLQIEVIAEAIQAAGYSDPKNPSDVTRAVYLAWADPVLGGHYYDGTKWLPDNYR